MRGWQRFLAARGFTGPGGTQLAVDGDCGPATEAATRAFQVGLGLASGVVDDATREAAASLGLGPLFEEERTNPRMQFVQARNYTRASRAAVDLVVFHTMEAPEKPGTALAVAQWFAGDNAPQASAHYCVDRDQVVQCVRERDVAWHAPGANRSGIGVEHAGYARQKLADWQDEYSAAMLRRSAALVAAICRRWQVPPVWLDAAALKRGERGITGHAQCTDAWSAGKGHTDPGPHFPHGEYVAMVVAALG